MRKVLTLFLALVLSISCLSEGEVVETSPEITEAPIVEEVTNETTEVVEESRDEVPEKVEEIVTEEPRETVQETPAVVEDTLETVEPETPEETVNEQEAEEPEELEPIPQEEPSKDVEDSNVDDSGTGSTEHDEVLPEQSEAETEASTESGEDDVVDADKASEEHSVEATSEVITIPGEKDEEETGTTDVGTDEPGESESEPEKEVSSETEEEQPEVSEEEQPEDEDLEDEETLETEEGDDKSDLEEGVEQDADEVSEGDSVLEEEPPMLMFAMAGASSSEEESETVDTDGGVTSVDGHELKSNDYRRWAYDFTATGLPKYGNPWEGYNLFASDATNTSVITFHPRIPDKTVQFTMYVNGTAVEESGLFGEAHDFTITYADLYKNLTNGKCTVTIKCHSNAGRCFKWVGGSKYGAWVFDVNQGTVGIYSKDVEYTWTFNKFTTNMVAGITIWRTDSNDPYPGDTLSFSNHHDITTNVSDYSYVIEWYVNDEYKGEGEDFSFAAPAEGQVTVYAKIVITYTDPNT